METAGRWTLWTKGGLSGLIKKHANVRIVQLQNLGNLLNPFNAIKTHGKLQNMDYNGKWKIIDGKGTRRTNGKLGDNLRTPGKNQKSAK